MKKSVNINVKTMSRLSNKIHNIATGDLPCNDSCDRSSVKNVFPGTRDSYYKVQKVLGLLYIHDKPQPCYKSMTLCVIC